MVFAGSEHESLRLPALGGSLFDPDRFPFLEGRAPGTNWKEDSFTNIIGFPNIEFRLATRDPDGNCTYGVTRTASDLTISGSAGKLQNLISWDDKKYVNIWVVRSFEDGSSAAAFAFKPGSGPNMDGIFCLYNYFGDIRESYLSRTSVFKYY